MGLDFWRTVTLGAATAGQALFVLLYLTFPWWRTFTGRALFAKALFLFTIISFAFFSRVLGFRNVDEIFVWLYGLLAVGIWFQSYAFLRVKLQHRDPVSGNGNN